jgi:predicted metal-binding membrane protein
MQAIFFYGYFMTNNTLQAPLKDRMIVYLGVGIVLLFSWLYILGMGWHMNTLPFIDNPSTMSMDMSDDSMNMKKDGMKGSMDMDKPMNMNEESSFITDVLTWMPPMGNMWVFSDFFLLFMMWTVMMVAMMTPSILPMLMLYTTLNSRKKMQGQESISPLVLLSGYLSSWVLFSLFITLPQYFLHTNGLLNMMMEPMHMYLAAFVLIMAGIYQFTPYKDACLNVCQSPLSFLTNNWQDGKLGAFIIGYKHGFYCVGCCWALMLTLFALGVMNILWVIVLTIFVLFEKLSYNYPLAYRRVVGVFLIVWGAILAL